MKKRWLLNLILLAVVAGLITFVYMRPKDVAKEAQTYELTQLKLAEFKQIKVEFPALAPVHFEKVDQLWRMTAPYKARADQATVNRILAIIAAKSAEKFPANDLSKYGLDNPQMRLKLTRDAGEEVFNFGTYNPVTEDQYIGYKDAVYLLPTSYAEVARTQAIELIDKAPLSPQEAAQIASVDLSKLEQWQEQGGLTVAINTGNWQVSLPKAKPTQNELNEWLDMSWVHGQATSVELYKQTARTVYASFEIKLKDGKKVHFDKIAEAPELILARVDEGLAYHFPNDVGFVMLNPPINLQK